MVKYVDVTLRISLEDSTNTNVALEEADWIVYFYNTSANKEKGVLSVSFIDARKVTRSGKGIPLTCDAIDINKGAIENGNY